MQSFSMGIGYLRLEALKSGFIIESDRDDKLIERLSQVIRRLGPEDAEHCDALSAGVEWIPKSEAEAPEEVVEKKEDDVVESLKTLFSAGEKVEQDSD